MKNLCEKIMKKISCIIIEKIKNKPIFNPVSYR